MAKKPLPSPETLRQLLDYDASTGLFLWKSRSVDFFPAPKYMKIWNTKYAGMPTFTTDDGDGYKMATVLSIKMKSHRVAWAIHFGEWPDLFIDHINGVKYDNRIENLRIASNSENMMNAGIRENNKSGVRGVYWCSEKNKWAAGIRVNGRNKFLGRFDDLDEAKQAYKAGSEKYHGEFGKAV